MYLRHVIHLYFLTLVMTSYKSTFTAVAGEIRERFFTHVYSSFGVTSLASYVTSSLLHCTSGCTWTHGGHYVTYDRTSGVCTCAVELSELTPLQTSERLYTSLDSCDVTSGFQKLEVAGGRDVCVLVGLELVNFPTAESTCRGRRL